MKKYNSIFYRSNMLLVLVTAVALAFTSCSEEDKPAAVTTSLELTVKDMNGNIITNGLGYAELYATATDWSNDINKIGEPKFADANGKIKFDNLAAQKYYWRVHNSCRNNFTTSITTPSALVANTVNTADVPLVGTFTLNLNKNPAYQGITFEISINGAFTDYMNATEDAKSYLNIPENSTVRIVQAGGSGFDKTYTVTGFCGETTTVTYPD